MNDITSRKDIEFLVNSFYNNVEKDPTIGFIFNDVAKVDWKKHLPKMYNFWSGILFGETGFDGNPMLTHIQLSQKTTMQEKQFATWLLLWIATIDAHFTGSKADEAKIRGANIANMMQQKIKFSEPTNCISE